ncbi:TonB-dependent receptor [Pseudomonas aeruginosa]|nr:TonB-dependent receptor [Pseudomonas aeruginosa]
MIEIRSLRDLLRLLFIYQREFKLAALSAVVIIVLGAFLLPAKYESNARLLVKPGRDSTLPIEISNRQALVMPSTQRDPIVDEERLLTGRPIVRQVAERYLEVLANRPPPEGLWKRTKFYVKKAIGAVFDGIRVTLETFGVIEETTAVERLAKDLEKKFEVTHAAGSTVMEISFTWSEPEVAQEVVKAWIEIYMEERTQALGRKSLYAFYEAQTADSAAQIKSYKAQILKHLNEIGASSIEDRLQDLSERINVLRGEAACRSGGLDPDSAQCRDTLARVERNAGDASVDPNRLNKVYVNAINAAKERTSGIDLRSNIRWGAGDYGAFSSTLGYTLVLSHDYQQSDDYPSENQRDSLDSHDWRSKLNASLTWDYAQFTSTLFAVRYGSVTNAAGSGRLSPWTVFNASARYRLNERASVGLTVNNLLDQIKEDDSDGWPYYPTGNYDAMGRQWWLDFSYHFGG